MKLKIHSILMCLALLSSTATFASVTIPTEKERQEQSRIEFKEWLSDGNSDSLTAHKFEVEPSVNEHLLFANRVEAIAWTKTKLPEWQKAFDPKMQLLEEDARYALLDQWTNEVWSAYQALFPAQTAGLPIPPVVLLETKTINAFVTGTDEGKQIGHAIFVFTGILDAFSENGQLNKDMVTGVIAHELAHSVFRHLLNKYRQKINHFYDRTKVGNGYQSSENAETPTLDKLMRIWMGGARLVGELTMGELENLPSKSLNKAILMEAFNQLQLDSVQPAPKCAAAKEAFSNWSHQMRYSVLNNSIVVTSPDGMAAQTSPGKEMVLKSFSESTSELVAKEQNCLANAKISLLDLVEKSFGIPAEQLKSNELFKTLDQLFSAGSDPVTGFQAVVSPIRDQMKKIESAVNFDQIEFYSFEEHADEVSALVHAYLHNSPYALSSALMRVLELDSKSSASVCAKLLASKAAPVGGSFTDPHRSQCFRVHHLLEFNKAIGEDAVAFANKYLPLALGTVAPSPEQNGSQLAALFFPKIKHQ